MLMPGCCDQCEWSFQCCPLLPLVDFKPKDNENHPITVSHHIHILRHDVPLFDTGYMVRPKVMLSTLLYTSLGILVYE